MNITLHPLAPLEVMALFDGQLSAAAAQTVSAHLEDCVECSKLAGLFRSTSNSLSQWEVENAPARLTASVMDLAVRKRTGCKVPGPGIFIRASFWTWKRWAGGFAIVSASLLLLLAMAIPNRMRAPDPADRYQWAFSDKAIETQHLVSPVGGPVLEPKSRSLSNGPVHGPGDHLESDFPVAPMIARKISLTIVVKDFMASRATLDRTLERHHSYAAELTANTTENAPRSLQASLRVPAPELGLVLNDLKMLGRVENETQSGEEVTEQHADLLARLKNARATEQRLLAILQQRTGKITDLLQVEQEIARVRGEIEQLEAEQQTLEHRVDFAALNLNLVEEYKAQLNAPAASVLTRLHNALVTGFRNASETVLGIVLFFAEYGLTLLLWLLILVSPAVLLWRRYRRTLATL